MTITSNFEPKDIIKQIEKTNIKGKHLNFIDDFSSTELENIFKTAFMLEPFWRFGEESGALPLEEAHFFLMMVFNESGFFLKTPFSTIPSWHENPLSSRISQYLSMMRPCQGFPLRNSPSKVTPFFQ